LAKNSSYPAVLDVSDDRPMPPDVRQVVDRMSDRDWERLILELGRYAVYKSRRFFWRTGQSGELPTGEMAESIVSKAIVLWLTGRRRWNPSEYADLPSFLKGVIDSLLSHAASTPDNRKVELRPAGFETERASDAPTPESELMAREQAAVTERTLAEVITQSREDPIAIAIIEAVRGGAVTRRDIVRSTGQPAGVIDNGLKRLRRIGAAVSARMQMGRETS
jgi:hypothetical protein